MYDRLSSFISARSGGWTHSRVYLVAAAGICAIVTATLALIFFSTLSVDSLSRQRQQQLVANVLADSRSTIAHDQEAVTVWDEAIVQVRAARPDFVWIDNNLGTWLYHYYRHDETYVLNAQDQPIYAMKNGERGEPEQFEGVRPPIRPLVAELRRIMSSVERDQFPADRLSPVAVDLAVLNGQPSIVSVKPIVTDTGLIKQAPGTEFLHISVQHLNTAFADQLREQYGFARARFSPSESFTQGNSSLPLLTRSGEVIGYFLWRPFTPGAIVFRWIAPVLLGVFAAIALILLLLIARILKRTHELRESNAAVQHLAFHDALTDLPNRALFEDRLEHALSVYRLTAERRVALLFLDLDRFKAVNDTLGHAAGDKLICAFARRLTECVRTGDTVARLGGDEFAIILDAISPRAELDRLCQRIVAEASRPFAIDHSEAHVGVSIGVALAGRDGLDMTELARRADVALYDAKARGRDQYRLFSPEMDEPIRARRNAERDLREAMTAEDQLSVAYQPTYSAISGELVGVEALVRWQHPENGGVPPSIFIPVAEESGLIEPLGEWVLRRACKDARDWPIPTVSINVSPVQLRKPHFATRVISIINAAGIEPDRIEIEITETAILQDAPLCATNLRLLRAFGLRVALDDFGTGYSSFSHFNEFEVDRLKIDRTFVDKIDVSEGGSAIIQAMVELARSSGFRTTAECVETEEQKSFLQDIGCDDLQGFLMAYPVGPEAIDELFEQTKGAEASHAARR